MNRTRHATTGKDGPVDEFDLENHLPYLLNRVGVHIALAFEHEVREYGMTLAMFRALASLKHFGTLTLTELSVHTTADISTLSRLVSSMERKGLVKRGRADEDGRAISLELTAAGTRLANRFIPYGAMYERVALLNVDPADVALLKRLLKQIYANVSVLPVRSPRRRHEK
jgi:MarR family transcriptional regulator, organic hydroperoxide resistance regulator